MKSFLLAISFLTILRFRADSNLQTSDFSRSLWWFPVAGLLVGGVQWGAASISGWIGFPSSLTALVIVASNLIITGGLHLDGIADTADGFGAGNNRESALRIMKDDRTGVFGIAAIVLALLARYSASQFVVQKEFYDFFLIAPLISRTLLPLTMTILPYARDEGTAFPFSRGSFMKHSLPSVISGIVCVIVVAGTSGAAILTAGVIAIAFSGYSFLRIRGFTGDTLGCQVELTEIAVLFVPF